MEPGLILLTVVTLLLANFGSLTVRVDEGAVKLRFGVGLIRRTIPLDRIQAAARVRNRWWYGWGIRLTPHGWLWNVAGPDAVNSGSRMGRCFESGRTTLRVSRRQLKLIWARKSLNCLAGRVYRERPRTDVTNSHMDRSSLRRRGIQGT